MVSTRVLVFLFGTVTKVESLHSRTHSLDWDSFYSYSTPIQA